MTQIPRLLVLLFTQYYYMLMFCLLSQACFCILSNPPGFDKMQIRKLGKPRHAKVLLSSCFGLCLPSAGCVHSLWEKGQACISGPAEEKERGEGFYNQRTTFEVSWWMAGRLWRIHWELFIHSRLIIWRIHLQTYLQYLFWICLHV